jgi:hypothetical protein
VQLHRFYNQHLNDHFYTTDPRTPGGYVDESELDVMFVFINNPQRHSPPQGAVFMYRCYNPVTKDHFYTTDRQEAENAINNDHYVSEFGLDEFWIFDSPVAVMEDITATRLNRLFLNRGDVGVP